MRGSHFLYNPDTGAPITPVCWEDGNGNQWLGQLEKAIDLTWEGNDANNREIDLGDDYDDIEIFLEEPMSGSVSHFARGRAFRTVYDVLIQIAGSYMNHISMASANGYFQGKMTGPDANKIKLGSSGSSPFGSNKSGWTYRLIGRKYTSMV